MCIGRLFSVRLRCCNGSVFHAAIKVIEDSLIGFLFCFVALGLLPFLVLILEGRRTMVRFGFASVQPSVFKTWLYCDGCWLISAAVKLMGHPGVYGHLLLQCSLWLC